MEIEDLQQIESSKLEPLLQEEKEIMLREYLWDTEYLCKLRLQSISRRRMLGFAAFLDREIIAYIGWRKGKDAIALQDYYFSRHMPTKTELRFLKYCLKMNSENFSNNKIQGQLIHINNKSKSEIFKELGFHTTRREYQHIDLKSTDVAEVMKSQLHVHNLSGYSEEKAHDILSAILYSSYKATQEAQISNIFSTLEGCKQFIHGVFHYPVFGKLRKDFSLIAWSEIGKPIGAILVTESAPETGHVVQLAVIPEFQSQGIGRFLMTEAMRTMYEKNIKDTVLMVTSSNKPAVDLYRSLGFRTIRNFYALRK